MVEIPEEQKQEEKQPPAEETLQAQEPEERVVAKEDRTKASNIDDDLDVLLTNTEKTDLTDGGETTLHSHSAVGQWTLVDSGTYTTTTTLSSSLDGDTDLVYKIVLIRQSSTAGHFQMSFNNDTDANEYSMTGITVVDGARVDEDTANAGGAGFDLSIATRLATTQNYVEVILYAKQGYARVFNIEWRGADGTSHAHGSLCGIYATTNTNITRIDIIDASGSGHSGKWAIYKATDL